MKLGRRTARGSLGMTVAADVMWPAGRRFAFTVFDDCDLAQVETLRPVYDFLEELGILTTKSVWPMRGESVPVIGGQTCDDADYLEWVLDLQRRGFEIGSHGATPATTPREHVVAATDRFRELFGHDPASFANHSGCNESIYWGSARVGGIHRLAYNLMIGYRRRDQFRGHVEGDPLFWGDICRDRFRYVRNFTFADIDTLAACPMMPYHDPKRPYVSAWFASSEGRDVTAFNACLSEEAQDRLEAAGSACIMYTHFASGFVREGVLDARFRDLMTRLASKAGWFVPVTTLLDHVRDHRGLHEITPGERRGLERRWLRSKVHVGPS
jgi:hypothetical protein